MKAAKHIGLSLQPKFLPKTNNSQKEKYKNKEISDSKGNHQVSFSLKNY